MNVITSFASLYTSVVKGTVKEKWKGYRLKANHFSSKSRPMKVISDFPVSRNWYTTLSKLYENKYIYNFV